MKMMTIKPTTRADIPGLKIILDETQLFPADMLDALLAPSLSGDDPSIWLTAHQGHGQRLGPVGFCYAVPEEMTDGTWNMRALAVRPGLHRQGAGRAIVAALEAVLRVQEHRILLVDTASAEEHAPARAFYGALGMTEAACIPDFWAEGEDKITYMRRLR